MIIEASNFLRSISKQVSIAVMMLIGLSYAASWPALAHHSLSELYDRDSSITLSGTVTDVSWVNPHVQFKLDVTNDDGSVDQWLVELSSPNALLRRGWSRDTLSVGDVVALDGFKPLLDIKQTAAQNITTAAGETVMGTSDGDWMWQQIDRVTISR